MFKAAAIFAVGVLVVAGGITAFSLWRDARFTDCQSRSTRLEAVPLLTEQPNGVLPDTSYSGCDVDRLIAYAGRQYHSEANEPAIVTFYQQAAERDAWQVSQARVTTPGAGVASLCASKDLDGNTAYVNLSFPLPGIFDLHIAESPDSGAHC